MDLLTNEELITLTHRKKKSAQRAALNQMGIDYKVRPDGSVAVLKTHLEKIMGGISDNGSKKRTEPNWGAMRA